MVFKMGSQPVRCKQVRSQVRSNNNHRFYFSRRDVAKTSSVRFVKSIPMHSLSPSIRAKSMYFKITIGQ